MADMTAGLGALPAQAPAPTERTKSRSLGHTVKLKAPQGCAPPKPPETSPSQLSTKCSKAQGCETSLIQTTIFFTNSTTHPSCIVQTVLPCSLSPTIFPSFSFTKRGHHSCSLSIVNPQLTKTGAAWEQVGWHGHVLCHFSLPLSPKDTFS